jgi:hypothetical protein
MFFKSRLALDVNRASCLIDAWGSVAMHEAGHWHTSSSEVKNQAVCMSTLP